AVRLALESGATVSGAMAPVADCYRPDLRPPPDVALLEHRELAQALAAAGCDLLLVETVVAADEGLVAVRAAVETGLPVWVAALAMPDGSMRSGDDLRAFFRDARSAGARAALINCVPPAGVGAGLDDAAASGLLVGAYAPMRAAEPLSRGPVTPARGGRRETEWRRDGGDEGGQPGRDRASFRLIAAGWRELPGHSLGDERGKAVQRPSPARQPLGEGAQAARRGDVRRRDRERCG